MPSYSPRIILIAILKQEQEVLRINKSFRPFSRNQLIIIILTLGAFFPSFSSPSLSLFLLSLLLFPPLFLSYSPFRTSPSYLWAKRIYSNIVIFFLSARLIYIYVLLQLSYLGGDRSLSSLVLIPLYLIYIGNPSARRKTYILSIVDSIPLSLKGIYYILQGGILLRKTRSSSRARKIQIIGTPRQARQLALVVIGLALGWVCIRSGVSSIIRQG